MLRREGVIDVWKDRRIVAGEEIDTTISENLERADLALLLVSPDFLASDYCYEMEMNRAMERHDAGEARVLPVILRPCDWHGTPFGKLLATPTDGKPVTKWPDLDEAFHVVTKDIRRALEQVRGKRPIKRVSAATPEPHTTRPAKTSNQPRSSNLRVRQTYTQAEKDRFLHDSFEYMANFFEGSLEELHRRNPTIETTFRRIDAQTFAAVIYRDGDAVSRCQVRLGRLGRATDSIEYSMSDAPKVGSFNETVSVEADEQMLGLKPLGMQMGYMAEVDKGQMLTQEGAAEFYWAMLMAPLQR